MQPGVQAPTKAGSETLQDRRTLHSGPLNPLPLAPGHPPSASRWVVPCGAPLLFPSPSHSLLGEPRPLLSFRPYTDGPQTCGPSPGSPLSSHWLHDASPGKPLQRDASHTRLLIPADPSTLPPQKLRSLDAEANALGSCPLFRACTPPSTPPSNPLTHRPPHFSPSLQRPWGKPAQPTAPPSSGLRPPCPQSHPTLRSEGAGEQSGPLRKGPGAASRKERALGHTHTSRSHGDAKIGAPNF